jgi:hypothetical protein
VLLGFAEWDKASGKIKSFKKSLDTYRPRYLGVRAEAVESATGRLALRVQSTESKDVALIYVDLLDAKNMFAFGLADGRGGVNRVLTVDKDGNVIAKGVISGAAPLKAGDVYVQSGQATDGVHLPLPAGIKLQQVTSGAISLHIMLTPNFVDSAQPAVPTPAPAVNPWTPRVKECFVDREDMAVHCANEWFNAVPVTAGAGLTTLPGVCDYLLIATVNS